jgi:hypothetical protein
MCQVHKACCASYVCQGHHFLATLLPCLLVYRILSSVPPHPPHRRRSCLIHACNKPSASMLYHDRCSVHLATFEPNCQALFGNSTTCMGNASIACVPEVVLALSTRSQGRRLISTCHSCCCCCSAAGGCCSISELLQVMPHRILGMDVNTSSTGWTVLDANGMQIVLTVYVVVVHVDVLLTVMHLDNSQCH